MFDIDQAIQQLKQLKTLKTVYQFVLSKPPCTVETHFQLRPDGLWFKHVSDEPVGDVIIGKWDCMGDVENMRRHHILSVDKTYSLVT